MRLKGDAMMDAIELHDELFSYLGHYVEAIEHLANVLELASNTSRRRYASLGQKYSGLLRSYGHCPLNNRQIEERLAALGDATKQTPEPDGNHRGRRPSSTARCSSTSAKTYNVWQAASPERARKHIDPLFMEIEKLSSTFGGADAE